MGVRSASVVAVVGLFLLVPLASASFLQTAADAARTGAVDAEAPEWDDVAWTVRLPGGRVPRATPLVLGEDAYVLAEAKGREEGLTATGIYRLALETGDWTELVRIERPPLAWASDGARLYVVDRAGIAAYAAADGALAWTLPFGPYGEPPSFIIAPCAAPALRPPVLYVGCRLAPSGSGPLLAAQPAESRLLAVDVDRGEVLWTWVQDVPTHAQVAEVPNTGTPGPTAGGVSGVVSIPPVVYVTTVEYAGRGGVLQQHVWALSDVDGDLLWATNSVQSTDSVQTLLAAPTNVAVVAPAAPTGTTNVVFVKFKNEVQALNTATGEPLWTRLVGRADEAPADFGAGFAMRGDALFVASYQSIARMDAARETLDWETTLPRGQNEAWPWQSLTATRDALIARSAIHRDRTTHVGSVIYSFDADSGNVRWRHVLERPPETYVWGPLYEYAVGDRVVVVAGIDGSVTLLGRTAASILPVATLSSLYPAPGEEVVLDLAGTRAGAGGPPTLFRVDWGDGNVTEWAPSPTFRHAFPVPGEHLVRAHAANDAGQSSSTTFVVAVGGTPPRAPSLLDRAFAPEHEELTFFVLGLVVTGAAGGFGFARFRRRRHRLARELAAVDAAYARTRHDSLECEAALRERRVRARGLLVDGRLTEAQYAVLEARTAELTREARRSVLDTRFSFLPHGMALALGRAIADGRITAWERTHLLRALEAEPRLTEPERQATRRLIEEWAEREVERTAEKAGG